MNDALIPKFRHSLKAEIIRVGYRTLKEFVGAMHTDLPRMSRIVSGWEIPGPGLQHKMAKTLGITLRELRDLIQQ